MGGKFVAGEGAADLSFTVRDHTYGKLIDGHPTMDDFTALLEAWNKQAKKQGKRATLHPGIARAEKAGFAVAFDQKAWLEDIDNRLKVVEDPQLRWFFGPYTGVSSLTIFAVLADDKRYAAKARREVGTGELPMDGDDWGRCYRCIVDCGFVDRLDHLVEKDPRWARLVDAWGALSTITAAYYAHPGHPHEDPVKGSLAKTVDHLVHQTLDGEPVPTEEQM